jgi:hypothetical protein
MCVIDLPSTVFQVYITVFLAVCTSLYNKSCMTETTPIEQQLEEPLRNNHFTYVSMSLSIALKCDK